MLPVKCTFGNMVVFLVVSLFVSLRILRVGLLRRSKLGRLSGGRPNKLSLCPRCALIPLCSRSKVWIGQPVDPGAQWVLQGHTGVL